MAQLPRDPRSIHVGPSAPAPKPVPAAASKRPRARRSRRWPWVAAALLLVIGLPVAVVGLSAWGSWRGVERVELADVLAGSSTGTNYLVVGTDSRDGVDADTANAGVIFGADVAGERTDTIAVLRVEGDAVSLLAIPRDLYVPLATGSTNRINAAFAFGGPEALVATVQDQLGIGIDHYLEVDLAGFLGLVDALGGVTIDFPHPAFDDRSGLAVETAGPNELDGSQALAYVRSRRYTEVVDGQQITDPTSDLGRVERQQRFLAAVMAELGATRNPFTLIGAMGAVGDHVAVDQDLGLVDAARLGLRLRGAEPASVTVPTDRFITDSGADVLVLNAESDAVLAPFRG
ncbi:MAG: LCP family protein [Actinomycetota bacterium]